MWVNVSCVIQFVNNFASHLQVSNWDERDVILEEGSSNNPGLLLVIMVIIISAFAFPGNVDNCGSIILKLGRQVAN